MRNRLFLIAGLALGLFAVSPSVSLAQKVTMEWENAPLSDVVRAFAKFSGRTIVVAPDAGDRAVTASFQDVDWERAFDLMLSGLGLTRRVDAAGVIHVERRPSARPGRRDGASR
jgi:type II secretory pathway component HofQ